MSTRSAFSRALAERQPRRSARADRQRAWVFVAYDQLNERIGALRGAEPGGTGVVLVESPWKAGRRPYHKQKLALVLASLRHFAIELAQRGFAVRHVVHDGPYRDALAPLARELGPLTVMEPAERELREDLAPLVRDGALRVVPHDGWLTTADQFRRHRRTPPWRMAAYYELVRRETGILMEPDGEPAGGRFSFDTENREPWRGEPPAAQPPRFRPDAITTEVAELVEQRFGDHPGRLDPGALPASRSQVDRLWAWARESCLQHFGPFEDAMSVRSTTLFHTRISALLHLHRLLPRDVIADVLAMDELPLQSREGFVRQVLGWREFVRHVHRETDGLRDLPGGAKPNVLGADRPLPPAFWGAPSGLHCLDEVVRNVWEEGYGHHITRLMVLANLATLLDVDPRELTDWFWAAYTDAFDWVVEPNVLGMGTFAVGPLFTTKPYVSGAAYLDRMSDYCGQCAFHPKRDCPITPLYWAFLARHADRLRDNPRLAMPMRSLARRAPTARERDARIHARVAELLAAGERVTPDALAE
ncbi:MAG: cryptochrome/photolyase family protein [Planctomycetes bacterium]|nr:cryptochrome/photolyase family protein [Planctomycetota bacterium]